MLNKYTKLLFYGNIIWYLGEGMLGPLFAVFAGKVGGDVLEISWAWAAYLLVMGFVIIVAGKLSDGTLGKERLMVAGFAMNATFTFGYLLVSSPLHLLFVQAGLGVATALAMPTWEALYSKHQDRKHAGFEWGLAEGAGNMLMGLAIIVGGLVVTYFSFTALFLIMGTIQTIATIYQSQILWK